MSTFLVDLLSGFAAGVNVTLVGHPFDTIKTRLAVGGAYKGLGDCVKTTFKEEGIGGFYKGVAAPLFGQLFFRSAMFSINAAYMRWASEGGKKPLSYFDYGIGGTVTWGICTAIECPLQMAAVQMQVQRVNEKTIPGYTAEFKTVGQYVLKAPQKYGLRALYGGLVPHLARNMAGGFFHFGAFEYLRREYAKSKGVAVTEIGLGANMVAGSIGGFLFWAPTYALDIVKSVTQADHLDPAKRKYKGTADAFAQLWREGGAKRFTRGMSACLLRSVPANAVLLTTAFRVKELGYAWVAAGKAGAGATSAAK